MECWGSDTLGCHRATGSSGFGASQRWKVGVGERGLRTQSSQRGAWGLTNKKPSMLLCSEFSPSGFQEKIAFVPTFPPGCHRLSAGRRRLKDQDRAPIQPTLSNQVYSLQRADHFFKHWWQMKTWAPQHEGWNRIEWVLCWCHDMPTSLPGMIEAVWVLSPSPVTNCPQGKQMIKNDSDSEWEGEIRSYLKRSKVRTTVTCAPCYFNPAASCQVFWQLWRCYSLLERVGRILLPQSAFLVPAWWPESSLQTQDCLWANLISPTQRKTMALLKMRACIVKWLDIS